jgi:hypothetical protein
MHALMYEKKTGATYYASSYHPLDYPSPSYGIATQAVKDITNLRKTPGHSSPTSEHRIKTRGNTLTIRPNKLSPFAAHLTTLSL